MDKHQEVRTLQEFNEELKAQQEELTTAVEELLRKQLIMDDLVRELEVKNHELDQLLYMGYHHGLRLHSLSLQGLLNLISAEGVPSHLAIYIDKMQRTVDSLQSLIGDFGYLHDVAQANTENCILLEEFVAQEWKALCEVHAARTQNASLVIHKTTKTAPFITDTHKLSIILKSILSNAIQYQHPDRPLRIDISLAQYCSDSQIFIGDNGIGIAQEILPKVFDIFFRGTEVSKGMGIGLYIAQKAVHTLQGQIEIQSEEGEFTEVRLFIPNLSPQKAAESFDLHG